jgi:hypothetical protein
MFGLSGLGMKVAIAAILFSIISGGYFYIKSLQSELALAAEVQQKLEDNIKAKDAAMDQMKKDVENMNRIQGELSGKLKEAEATSSDLAKRFNVDKNGNERNIGRLAAEKPTEIEGKVNQGTKDALRCNEIITGSPLTDDEKSGKVKNNICPKLIPAPEKKK